MHGLAIDALLAAMQKWDAAEGLLYVCRKLLSQPYISPIYAMLLYQWLLANRDAGGAEQRQKHINLLTAGCAYSCYLKRHGCFWLAD